jgi:hypothetical protein
MKLNNIKIYQYIIVMSKVTQRVKTIDSYTNFLKEHFSSDKENITNTRIGDKKNNIYGGSYNIPETEYNEFLNLYYNNIISKNKIEYLTEKQLNTGGPLLIDIDLRFPYDTTVRKYNIKHIESLLYLILDELKKIYEFDETYFHIFIFEKPKLNRIEEKNITKDGIHIIIGIKTERRIQILLRKIMITKITEIWDDLKQNWEEVFDNGISEGYTAWQLYGSRKPNNDAYKLTQIYKINNDPLDDEFIIDKIIDFDVENNMEKLSVRNKNNPEYFYKSSFSYDIKDERKIVTSLKSNNDLTYEDLCKIKTKEELVERFIVTEYDLKELYDFTMSLPEKYYGKSSYDKWIRVGWALKNSTSDDKLRFYDFKLFIIWVIFSSKSYDFKMSDIRDLYEKWSFFEQKIEGVTKRSIMYWSKLDSPQLFKEIREKSIDYLIDQTIYNNQKGCGDYDIANVLHHIYKDDYVCSSVKTNCWYKFTNNRWEEIDTGIFLRLSISKELRNFYI